MIFTTLIEVTGKVADAMIDLGKKSNFVEITNLNSDLADCAIEIDLNGIESVVSVKMIILLIVARLYRSL